MIEKTDFWFSSAGQNRRLHIYLPDDYYESEERYPVMYMFDGHNLFYDSDATYGKSWGMKDFLDHWDKKNHCRRHGMFAHGKRPFARILPVLLGFLCRPRLRHGTANNGLGRQ